MDGFVELLKGVLVSTGVPDCDLFTNTRIELPGWFRSEKKWDLVVVRGGKDLITVVEVKSHVGPSFGNNFNNRAEEALGSATDLWAAYREGAFRPSARPTLGYLMVLEDSPQSRAPVATKSPHFEVFPEFTKASYRERYAVLLRKLLRERLYDGAALVLSKPNSADTGDYTQPDSEITIENLVETVRGAAMRAYRKV
jgi:hypothetical protein